MLLASSTGSEIVLTTHRLERAANTRQPFEDYKNPIISVAFTLRTEAFVDARHDNQQGFRKGGEGLDGCSWAAVAQVRRGKLCAVGY